MVEINNKPFPILNTPRLILREIGADDAEEVFFLRSDPDMLRYLDRAPAKSIDEALQWIRLINDSTDKNEGVTWAIALKDQPKLIGTITFWNVKKEHYRAEIGYALHTAHRGKGIMREAMAAVLDYGFKKLKLHSVEANVNPGNLPSIKILEKNQFVREAYHRENYYYNGKFLDSAIYSLINPFDKLTK
jgi:[ribosomal protein S5]-alanine N-acetyltransferase